MTAALRVISPGLGTSIQDGGRRGFRQSGVPTSGPLDRVAFRLANALVGNAPDAAALEMLVIGATLEVVAPTARIAMIGGVKEFPIATGDSERRIPAGRSVQLTQGAQIRIGTLDAGLCGYLAVEGGIDVLPCLGSASTYVRSALGGIDGRLLKKGDVIATAASGPTERPDRTLAEPFADGFDDAIRVVLGPQEDYFTPAAIEVFLSATYTITPQSDRMGFRLEGTKLAHAKGYNIVSDGIVPGSIQVPGDGQPIVLMADSQTAGGYPKIATVISADLPLLARRKPGRTIRFAAVSQAEAEAAHRKQEAAVTAAISNFKEVAEEISIDLEALASANLIGGVISADG